MGRRSRNQRAVDIEKLISKMKKQSSPPLRIGKDDLLARAREELREYQYVFAIDYGFGERATMDLIARIYVRNVLDLGPHEEHREKMATCLAELKERVKTKKEEEEKKKEEEKIRKEEEEKRIEVERMRKEEEEKRKEEER
uniref:101 kDa malaria antigen-like n=1 Tax=Crassostrea virginica TaxID=6565 RepID=A0A8B8EGQ4_CRAVI